jgi:4-aminobutyrate aminotransferase-like enzyme
VLLAKSGEKGNVVRMVGPLCINEKDAEKVVQVIEQAVTKYAL